MQDITRLKKKSNKRSAIQQNQVVVSNLDELIGLIRQHRNDRIYEITWEEHAHGRPKE